MSQADSSELRELDAAIRAAVDAVTTDRAPLDFVASLRRAAGLARQAGYRSEVEDRLLRGSREASDAARDALELARLASNDEQLGAHGVAGLRLARVDLARGGVVVDDLDIVCVATADGSWVARPREPSERALITIAGELQLLVRKTLWDAGEVVARDHHLDATRLRGSLATVYELRAVRRVVCGVGRCMITERRAVGLILDNEPRGRAGADWSAAMPIATTAAAGAGSIIAFSCDRDAFDGRETIPGRLPGGVPTVNLTGACCLAMRPRRILGPGCRSVRAGAGAIDAALGAFPR